MKFILLLFMPLAFIACNTIDNVDTQSTERSLIVPDNKPSAFEIAIHDSLVQIITKDIEVSGNMVSEIELSGVEAIKISKKAYYTIQLEEQEINFKKYLDYMSRFSKTNSPINNPQQLEVSKQKNNAVVAYLKRTIKTSSSQPELYKVVYYLRADAGSIHYNQQQTTFLDKDYKKIVADYNFLK